MSFSHNVKEELSANIPKSRHCSIAELAGIITFESKATNINDLKENAPTLTDEAVSRKYFTLLKKTLNIGNDIVKLSNDECLELCQMLKLSDDLTMTSDLILQQPCCKRAFIRGAFLSAGSISDPNKGYHFEIVSVSSLQAEHLMKTMNFFDVEAKIVRRAGKYVVYLKEGAQIVEILRVMDASHSVMELENIRVVKEVRGTVNRKVNCETANISKTVNAAVRQIEDITLIDSKLGLDTLPEPLQEIAQARLDNPDTALADLGELLDPPIGKSGVNHRFKKLAAIAEDLRG